MQSVHAEVLRLRVEVQSVFYSDREDIVINEWRFPKKSLVLVPTGPAHMDSNFWNTQDGEHPLNTFWADRFLAYPKDPQSGPRRKTATALGKATQGRCQNLEDRGEPRFISSGMADNYMPYGVGERTCPGRFFARREIVAFCANIVNDFDIEILTTEKIFESSSAFYGLGTQRPLKSVPFKIRRRARC
jgi:cytochrome P450